MRATMWMCVAVVWAAALMVCGCGGDEADTDDNVAVDERPEVPPSNNDGPSLPDAPGCQEVCDAAASACAEAAGREAQCLSECQTSLPDAVKRCVIEAASCQDIIACDSAVDPPPGNNSPSNNRPSNNSPVNNATPGGNPCAIPAEDLRVETAHFDSRAGTFLTIAGTCSRTSGGMTFEGYSGARATYVLDDETRGLAITELGGVLFQADIVVSQAPLSSSAKRALASRTGVPAEAIEDAAVVSDGDAAITVKGDALEAGVQASFFLPSSTSQQGWVRLSSTNRAALERQLERLGDGIEADLRLKYLSSAAGTPGFIYGVSLRDRRPYIEVEGIRQAP